MNKITEQPSRYRHLETKTVEELTSELITEYKTIAIAVEKAKPQLDKLITAVVRKIQAGGRMIYLGAGTGGRLSVLDVLELPTTYGMENGMIDVILAGGVDKLILALEEKEDDTEEAWESLQEKNISEKDIVVGISASGSTPFVLGGLKKCRENGITTCCIVNNPDSPISEQSDYPVEIITGPEFVTGSTRMKAGTSQKMTFDMISTTVMIQMGRVLDNSMWNVQLINDKITDRAIKILMEKAMIADYEEAKNLLLKHGGVKEALDKIKK
ncbi:MAG: N-acetylmuramic acid 6-phosphate etherase [Bacteroidota bacterium]|nr:N-acetylmuramic acid 6-phosphate etherase [Bacteroidota bacterium]